MQRTPNKFLTFLALLTAISAHAENRSIIFTSNCSWAPGQWTESSAKISEALRKHGWNVRHLYESEAARSCTILMTEPACKANPADPRCCPREYKALDKTVAQVAAREGVRPEALKPATKANLFGELNSAARELGPGDQVLLFLESHGSRGKTHSICTGDRVGGSLRVDDRTFNDALASVRASGARLAIIDDSCYGGASLPILEKHGCVLASVDPEHVSVSVQNTGGGALIGNAIGTNVVELLGQIPAATSRTLDFDGDAAIGLDELYLKALSNGMLANDVAQISASSRASTAAAQILSDFLREKDFTWDKGPVWPEAGFMPEIVLGPAYKASQPPFRSGAVLPDLLAYRTSFAAISALADQSFGLLATASARDLQATYAAFWKPTNEKGFARTSLNRAIMELNPLNASPRDVYDNLKNVEAGVRRGLQEFKEAFEAEQRYFLEARRADYAARYVVPGLSESALRATLEALADEGKIMLSPSRIMIGYGWDLPGDPTFLEREAATIGKLVAERSRGVVSPTAVASAIVAGEKQARASLTKPELDARAKAFKRFFDQRVPVRSVYATLRALLVVPMAQARFYDYLIRLEERRAGRGTAADLRAQNDCSSFKLFDVR